MKPSDVPMYGYKVEFSTACLWSEHSGEQYGDWHETWSNALIGIRKRTDPDKGYPDVVSEHDYPVGSDVYIVWCDYDEGDSFGWATSRGCEVAAITASSAVAEELAEWIRLRENHSYDDNVYNRKFTASTGEVFEVETGPWSGYFDVLNTVNVDCRTIGSQL